MNNRCLSQSVHDHQKIEKYIINYELIIIIIGNKENLILAIIVYLFQFTLYVNPAELSQIRVEKMKNYKYSLLPY